MSQRRDLFVVLAESSDDGLAISLAVPMHNTPCEHKIEDVLRAMLLVAARSGDSQGAYNIDEEAKRYVVCDLTGSELPRYYLVEDIPAPWVVIALKITNTDVREADRLGFVGAIVPVLTDFLKHDSESYKDFLSSQRLTDYMQRVGDRIDTRLDHLRPVWTWLQSTRVEQLFYTVFSNACVDTLKHYSSGEIAITATLGAYLCSHASQVRDKLIQEWESLYPKARFNFEVNLLDCQKKRDVGGADFAIVLEVNMPELHKRSSFTAFQAKRLSGSSFSFSSGDLDQLKRIEHFTHASYYLFYPAMQKPRPPTVIPARTLWSYLSAKRTRTVSWRELEAVGLRLADYFLYDFLAGWAGDERSPEEVNEFVIHVLQPVHVLQMRISVLQEFETYLREEVES